MTNKNNRIVYIIIFTMVWFLIIFFLILKYNIWNTKFTKFCCKEKEWDNTICFDVEIADNNESRAQWLMYRETLSDDRWMLFVFDKLEKYSFWMKNTIIPLAWIRMDDSMKIVDIIPMNPCKTDKCPSYIPSNDSMYVLEINQKLITEKSVLKTWDFCYIGSI